MKTLVRGSFVAAVVLGVACGGGDSPPVPATITFTPAAVSLDALGATAAVSVVVTDDKGRAIDNTAVTWTATGTSATLTPPATNATGVGTHAASISAVAEGQTLLTAKAGNITATLTVDVAQKATSIVAISGDNQLAGPGHALALPIAVQLRDRLDVPLTHGTVAFDIVDGGGSTSPATAAPTSDGVARTTWTLGSATTEHLSATDAAHTLTPVTFTATATAAAGIPTALIATAGGNDAVLAGANAPFSPAVKVVDATGAGVPGIAVSFAVTAGAGSINTTSVTTGADGVASLARWTMGSVGALNAVTATVPSLSPLEFDDAGCDNGSATGFAITLCYRTSMTATQRQAFVSAAARWGSIITTDIPDVTATDGFVNACGGSVQTYRGTIDDLLIFATVEPIDGPSNIVGAAGPCFVRTTGSLPLVGTMRFDVADVVALENRGLLNAVILHEMGHVLGIGTLWSTKGLLQNPSTTTSVLDTFFSGPNGIAGFDAIGGTTYTGGSKVPVENMGGTGTINGHWRESVLVNELMTGTINSGPAGNPLSQLTARSLQDLGYTVNALNADPFSLTLASRLPGAATDSVSLDHDILTFPLWTVDARGRATRVPR